MAKLLFLLASGLASVAYAEVGYDLPSPSYGLPGDLRADASEIVEEVDPIAELAANIPGGGIPGEDYPILSSVPDTGFLCEDQEFPGYFADIADEAGCQVFHICQEDFRLDSFLCPNGTIFNQQYFVCDWWFNVDCAASEEFFALNADIGVASGDELLRDASGLSNAYAAPPSNSYGAPAGGRSLGRRSPCRRQELRQKKAFR